MATEQRDYYTLTKQDVGRGKVHTPHGPVTVRDFMGSVQPCDVGKRIIRVAPDVWQVENNEQVRSRLFHMASDAREWGEMDARRELAVSPSESDRFPHHRHSMPADQYTRRLWLRAYAEGILNVTREDDK